MSDCDEEETLQVLIAAEVHKHSVLYNSKDPRYRDQAVRNLAWKRVSKQLQTEVPILKQKWKNMRDAYLRFRKMENDPKYKEKLMNKKTWYAMEKLRFLETALPPVPVSNPERPDSMSITDNSDIFSFDDQSQTAENEATSIPVSKKSLQQRIIEAVRDEPMLWDATHSKYRDGASRTDVWHNMAEHLDIDVETVKTKWKNLRCQYFKHKKNNQTWPLMDELKFLDAFSNPRVTHTGHTSKWSKVDEFEKFLDSSTTKAEPVVPEYMEAEEGYVETQEQDLQGEPEEQYTEDHFFALSLVGPLQRLPQNIKNKVKYNIYKIVYENSE